MKAVITIEDGKITVEVDSGGVIEVTPKKDVGTVVPAGVIEKSVELGEPFVDHKIVEPVAVIPDDFGDRVDPPKQSFSLDRTEIPKRGRKRAKKPFIDVEGNPRRFKKTCAYDSVVFYTDAPVRKFCSNACRLAAPGNRSKTTERREVFDDPWDCEMCRNAGDLCQMHDTMELNGQKPPKYRQVGNNEGV